MEISKRYKLLRPPKKEFVIDEFARENDPFIKFGIGINCYRSLLRYLVVMFFIISVVITPVFYLYHNNPDMRSHLSWMS